MSSNISFIIIRQNSSEIIQQTNIIEEVFFAKLLKKFLLFMKQKNNFVKNLLSLLHLSQDY